MPAIHIPDPLPPAITPDREVIEFVVEQDLEAFGENSLVARTWQWVLHGGGPRPISDRQAETAADACRTA